MKKRIPVIVAVVVVVAVIVIVKSQTFLSAYTMQTISREVAFFVLIALAQAVCLVLGGLILLAIILDRVREIYGQRRKMAAR